MPGLKKITAWSFSRYSAYQQCPFKAKLTILEKRQEPKNEAMLRGAALHDAIATYLKKGGKLPASIKALKSVLDPLRDQFKAGMKLKVKGMQPETEEQWAFTVKWTQTEWKNWADAWVRIALDVMWWTDEETVRVRDWKSGKMNDKSVAEYLEQIELYALAVLLRYPHCKRVIPDLFFIDAMDSYPHELDLVFTQKDVKRLKKTWEMRVKRMLADTKFAPKPGWQCPGCFFNHSTQFGWKVKIEKAAGPCKF